MRDFMFPQQLFSLRCFKSSLENCCDETRRVVQYLRSESETINKNTIVVYWTILSLCCDLRL